MTPYHTANAITLHNAPALDVARSLPDGSVNLIICDWPYFRVKSDDWDNQWATAADFLSWMGEHLEEYRRILAPNGSYYGFASPQMAARVEVLTGEWFNVLNAIRWVKDAGWHKKADEEGLRAYLRPWEAVIFAEHHNAELLRVYLNGEKERAGWTTRQVAEAFQKKTGSRTVTGMAGHWFSRVQWGFPTAENYQWLRELFNHAQPGEYLRREYEALRRPFNAHKDAPYTDVWDFPTVQAYKGKHSCEKPGAMFRHIIEMSSKPGDVVFDPMCGAGGSAYAARALGRVWIGGDLSAHWCGQTVKRLARSMDDWQPRATQKELVGLPLFNH